MGTNGTNTEKGFHVFATQAANWVGTKWALLAALLVIALWIVTGPYFHYSDTWQLIINTGTTVVTFLVVFLIQNTVVSIGGATVRTSSAQKWTAFSESKALLAKY